MEQNKTHTHKNKNKNKNKTKQKKTRSCPQSHSFIPDLTQPSWNAPTRTKHSLGKECTINVTETGNSKQILSGGILGFHKICSPRISLSVNPHHWEWWGLHSTSPQGLTLPPPAFWHLPGLSTQLRSIHPSSERNRQPKSEDFGQGCPLLIS